MLLSDRTRARLSVIGFPALLAALGILTFIWREPLFTVFRSAGSLRAWVEARGALAPLAFVGLQILQVVIFFIPGEVVQVAGGFAFGLWGGTLWSVIGILAGSLCNFGVGRVLGRPFVEAVFGAERARRVEAATGGGKAAAGFFILFAIPGIPKDVLTYAAGASQLPFGAFMVVSTLGRLPGIVGSAYMGSAVFEQDYLAAIIVVSVASVLFASGLVFHRQIHEAVAALISKKRRSGR